MRNNLSDESIRSTVVLNSWLKMGEVSDTVEQEFKDRLVKGWKRGENRHNHDGGTVEEGDNCLTAFEVD